MPDYISQQTTLDNIPQDNHIYAFLGTVQQVYGTTTDLPTKDPNDDTSVFNGDKTIKKDSALYGAIRFTIQDSPEQDYAIPFDKNIIKFPIVHETVLILKTERRSFWLPWGRSIYPNYHRDLLTFEGTSKFKYKSDGTTLEEIKSWTDDKKYEVKHKIKFLKPKQGDTIIAGRWGNTIRFSEFFLTDNKASSPSIFIRNFQNPKLDSKETGELVEEDFNKDGSSIYITSNKAKIPFISTNVFGNSFKDKKAYQSDIKEKTVNGEKFPESSKLTGHQIWMNTERILLAARTNEFLIFGAKNIGSFTGGKYSVDAQKMIYFKSSTDDVVVECGPGKNIFLNSYKNGKVFLGAYKNPISNADKKAAEIQHMVNGGDLKWWLEELIKLINLQVYNTMFGPTQLAPTNKAAFTAHSKILKEILSKRNFLSKN